MFALKIIAVMACAAFGVASAADNPPLPKKWHDVATEDLINDSIPLAKRLIDTPIVRSSRGCIGYLGQTKSGSIIVRHLLDKHGKPVCRPEAAYGPGTVNPIQ